MSSANPDIEQVEDASELKFPKGKFMIVNIYFIIIILILKSLEFENAETLMISEVFLLLEHRKNQAEQQEDLTETTETFVKTMNYTQRLAKFKNRDTIRAVRQ